MQRLVVTGAAGFIGARFVSSCLERGIPVVGVDLPEHFRARSVDTTKIHVVDRRELFDWLKLHHSSLAGVVHLGARTDTLELDRDLLNNLNTEYTKKVWKTCSEHAIPLIYASSGATFGDGSHGYPDGMEEISKLHPLNPYGDSKQEFDLWAIEQKKKGPSFCPPSWIGLKFFNVYGAGESHKNKMASVIFHAFHQIQSTGKMKLFRSHRSDYADGEQKRDFIAVEDIVKVLHFCLTLKGAATIANLGTGRARSFNELAAAIFSAMGRAPAVEYIDMPAGLRERYQYFTEAEMKVLAGLGYRGAFTSLEEGVAKYVGWLSSNIR